ncbi:sacsin N-terminal ATP-binding-like domain-containing protein [Mesorhizobium sp. L-8-3]|uniref:sacsin N-terminal ATP-binding-like domain-containing protein n=1 Tax=Mesorhizobium sp. L-8-3 TaxID=2744522 RepID=UPI0019291A87|nr:hypothetical protein [Mesorhizobium sp. L-8-3]BCH24116.1 hypothetical protein MesoLjLb_39010 [Mesorhizobium sp. L-8-3]
MARANDPQQFLTGHADRDAEASSDHLDSRGWHRFLTREIEKTQQVFRTKPKLLLAQVRNERQTADDYAGRELLELVQNAADAAAEVGGKGRIRIEISREGLIVANSGQPFRPSGVESLMTPHASDKPNRKVKLIGAKGLGFRALLNWSHEPIISSGALEIGFSFQHAESIIASLADESAELAEIYASEEEPAVPILAYPAFGDAMGTLGGVTNTLLLERARALRLLGYDTVVAAPFDDERSLERAIEQAAEFEPTFLLFVDALEEIELCIADRPTTCWRRTPAGADSYTLRAETGGEASEQSWICVRKRGELLLHGRRKARRYELAIAFRNGPENSPGFLHSYFPTSIPVPFAALFHATLELDSNRKAFKENSELNEGVLKALAAFYAEALAKLSKGRRIGNALDFLARQEPFPKALKDFEATVYRAVRPLAIIPTMHGGRIKPNDAKLGPLGYSSYLPTRLFGQLPRCRNADDHEVLLRLEVSELPSEAIVRNLRKAELSLDERAKAIVGIALNLDPKHQHRGLLLDQNGKPIQDNHMPFPPPASGERLPQLPDWARARFILPDLWKLVLRRMDGQNPRDKLRKLSGFGITEYSNESVIAALRNQAAKALGRGRRDPDVVQRALLHTIHALYSPENRRPPGIFKVMCQDGVWRDTGEVHLSEPFGQVGRINAALYGSAPEQLIGSAEDNGIDGGATNLAAFFEWIGVNRWPRAIAGPVPHDLRPVILGALPASIMVDDGSSRQTFEKHEIIWGYNFQADCSMIVGLQQILATAESDAILAWLAFDPRFDLSAPHCFPVTVRGRKDGKANFRRYRGALPDLVRKRIAAEPWLACKGDRHEAPCDAMVQPGSLTELFHVPRPAVVGSEERFGLSQYAWRRGLDHARVPLGLSDLSEAQIFALLRGLPERAPTEATVRTLYQQVLALDRFDVDAAPTERHDFLTNGKVQIHRGHVRDWVRPAEALYADQTGFPLAAREFLALIDLPPRRNTGNVAERFGVAALSQEKYQLEISSLTEETGAPAAMLRADLVSARPFIRALRLADTNVTTRLRRFDRMKLKVASAAEIAVTIRDCRVVGRIEPWTHVLEKDTLIVAIESYHQPAQISALAHEAIADGIAELFDLQSGADFVRLLSAHNDELRRILLRRMLPNLSDEEIVALLADIGPPDEAYEPVKVDAATLARGPTLGPAPAPAPADPAAPAGGQGALGPAAPSSKPGNPTAVTATPLGTGPTSASTPSAPPAGGRPVQIRVARATGPLSTSAHPDPYRTADAEEWTRLFEIAEGRFPLPVAHLQGRGAFGCDWLSFATETDRDAFKVDPGLTNLVQRFIESKSGTIELTGNEWRAAELRRARFFIYRIAFYPGTRDSAELTMVCDPFGHRHALLARYEFRIDAVEGRERFQLTPEDPKADQAA